jgi:mono/diheme cytochrome c family protein
MKPTYSSPAAISIRAILAAMLALEVGFNNDVVAQPSPPSDGALRAFEVVRTVLQHPRCQNCHIPGDAPLQGDEGYPHDQNVVRGSDGHGASAMECAACHQENNLPMSYGDRAPPGAPNWRLPPPGTKMVFIGVSPRDLCVAIKDRRATGGRDLAAMLAHIRDDKLVAWGWAPGKRSLPPATRAETVAAFKAWTDAGAPCPK